MTRSRFADLVVSFKELPCGICSESFYEGELSEFISLCMCLLNRDFDCNSNLNDLFESGVEYD